MKNIEELLLFLKDTKGIKDKNAANDYLSKLDESGISLLKKDFVKWKQNRDKEKISKKAHGSKLEYIKSLKHQCPEGEELYYYKKGGSIGCGCKKKEDGGEIPEAKCGAVAKFKKARKAEPGMKMMQLAEANRERKKKEALLKKRRGTLAEVTTHYANKNATYKEPKEKDNVVPKEWTPSKERATKKSCGGPVEKFKAACGKKLKKHQLGGSLNRIPFMLKGKNLPTAPKAENRYKNGFIYTNGTGPIDNDIRYSQYPTTRIISNVPYNMIPATITLTVQAPEDTTYIEVPELKRFTLRGLPVERIASTKNLKGNEYNTLKERFFKALKVSNPKGHWFYK